MKRSDYSIGIVIVALFFVNAACVQKKEFPGPAGYDFNHPKKYFMPEVLQEISGIAFHHKKTDTVYAIQDEDGKLFRLKMGTKQAVQLRFGKQGDYEDVAIYKDEVIVLKSNGHLYTFTLTTPETENNEGIRNWKDILPPGEYEGLFAEEETNRLYVLCKKCEDDNAHKGVSGFIFDLSVPGELKEIDRFGIDVKAIDEKTGKISGKKKLRFEPAALARNPATHQWFILSSTNKMLVIADENWQVKEVYKLNPATFRQPEGIAFDAAANLYISNEGDEVANGNILEFRYTKP